MENKKRLISLDEALKSTHSEIYWTESQQAAVRSFLVKQPKVDAVEVVHGRWIYKWDADRDPKKLFVRIVCYECNLHTGQKSNYCPNCGAKMDGDGNGQ